MRRRTFLASAGSSLAALPGCLYLGRDGRETDTPTPVPVRGIDTPRTTVTESRGGPGVTVETAVQHRGYVELGDDSVGIARPDQQFVTVAVTVPDGDVAREAFALRVGSGVSEPTTVERHYLTAGEANRFYDQGEGSGRGYLLYAVERPGSPAPVTLTWPGGEWTAPASFRERLAGDPPAVDATVAAPTEQAAGEPPDVAVTVANDGDSPRRFLGALNRSGPVVDSTPVGRVTGLVDGGATERLEVGDSWSEGVPTERVGDGEPDVTYRLEWAGGSDRVEVSLA